MKANDYLWDWPVRLSHWAMVIGVLGCYASARFHWLPMDWHFYFGYLALLAVVFRIVWGLVGSESARFSHFVRGPAAVLEHLKALFGTGYRPHAGHNPLGALAVLGLLVLVLVQTITGMFSSDEIQWYAPLSERVSTETMQSLSSWHRILEVWLLALIAIHVVAVVAYGLLKGERLIGPMLTGYKRGLGFRMKGRPAWLAWLVLVVVAAGLVAVVYVWPVPESVSSIFED